ncbi:MAG: hypothetical protein NTX15_10660 [Candidatus Kapabacteria bacterium]|nr:hypothetical protein [Candidatus Kapabacteria bacterium]
MVIAYAQQSASGCGILTPIDAIAVPARAIDSTWAASAEPAPYGLTELSRGTVAASLPHIPLLLWVSGSASEGWSNLTVGGFSNWSAGTDFRIGVRSSLNLSVFRGFSSVCAAKVGINAVFRRKEWTFGASIDDLAVVGSRAAPWVRVAAMVNLDFYDLALDVIMNSTNEMGLLLTGVWRPVPVLELVLGLLTAPTTIRLDGRISAFGDLAVVVGLQHFEGLGFSPHIALQMPW